MRSSCRSSSSSWDAWYKSSASWPFNQNCGLVPRALASRRAVEGVMPRRPLTISLSRTYETPIRSASSAWVMPSGLMNSSSSISPGGVGGRSEGILTCAISVISSVIVHDLNVFGAGVGPPEAHPPLIVDPDRVLSSSLARERLQAVARRRTQVPERGGLVELV